MKEVLIVNTAGLGIGGITTNMINYITFLSEDYHFVVIETIYHNDIVVNNLNKLGCQVISLPNRKKELPRYYIKLRRIMKENHIDVVHVHGNSATMGLELNLAKRCNIPVRIAHCHNSQCDHPHLHKLLNMYFKKSYTDALACSQTAGEWIFGKGRFQVLPNGIDIETFRYSESVRNTMRKELNIEDKFVVGHTGHMNEQKNHEKLFSIFAELRKQVSNAHLLCVAGDDEIPEHLTELMGKLGIQENVTVLHHRSDVNELLQAMDVFVFPSRWEGFGIALLEAQAAGLPCVVSDKVIREINLSGDLRYVSLSSPDTEWVEEIHDVLDSGKCREDCNDALLECDYNIRNCISDLEKVYNRHDSLGIGKEYIDEK